MPLVGAVNKRSCAYHSGDTSGKTYDSDGKVCSTLSKEDMAYVAAAVALCCFTLLVLGVIYSRRWFKSRRREAAAKVLNDRPMSYIETPLVGSTGRFSAISSRPRSPSIPVRPPLSPLSTSSSEMRTESSSSSGSHSLHSPQSDNFHFPILSADGHLLPPPPASSRRSWVDAGPVDTGERPLPTPPPSTSPIFAPIPRTPKRWSYQPAQEESPSPERNTGAVVGLYSGVEMKGDGSFELLREEYEVEPKDMGSSPKMTARVERPVGIFQPQRAALYRTISAEGEDVGYDDDSSGHGHRRF